MISVSEMKMVSSIDSKELRFWRWRRHCCIWHTTVVSGVIVNDMRGFISTCVNSQRCAGDVGMCGGAGGWAGERRRRLVSSSGLV
jgi:hypothetical protein